MEIKQTTKLTYPWQKRNWKMHESSVPMFPENMKIMMNGKIKRPGAASEKHLIIIINCCVAVKLRYAWNCWFQLPPFLPKCSVCWSLRRWFLTAILFQINSSLITCYVFQYISILPTFILKKSKVHSKCWT